MVNSIFQMFALGLSSVASWFVNILEATGMSQIFLAVVFFMLLRKYILGPLFSGAGSDKVTKQNKGGKNG